MKKVIPILLLALLASCSLESASSNVNSSQPPVTSATSLSSPSQPSTSSLVSNSSAVTSSTSTATSSSSIATLANIWTMAMGNINPNDFYGVTETLPNTLSTVNVVIVHAVYRTNGTLYGYAYEALVDGNAGSKSIRFRVGIANNTFAGFVMVSHQEHSGFGVKIINALRNNLAGKTANKDAIAEILVAALATRSGISETYDGMIPALEAIITHYLSKI
jgi:Na+-translocating ferredoxin:NAD+ oxidoreductase RnfG subunit